MQNPHTRPAFRRLAATSMLAISTAGFAVAVLAETRSASFGVSAHVVPACDISCKAVSFGTSEVLSAATVDAKSTLTTTCTAGSSFSIGMSAGAKTGAASGTGSGLPQAISVYGRITAGESSAAMGLHNETVIATIDF